MRLSYTAKLKSQVQEDIYIPLRVRQIIQSKCLRRPKSVLKTAKQSNNTEQFWVSPLKNMEAPEVIHRNKSQPKKNFYVININELSKKKNSLTPSKQRVSTQQDIPDFSENNVIQGVQKSLINKYSTPKCRVYTEPDQNDASKESFLNALQHQSGIQIMKEQLISVYKNLQFQLNITSQRELVRRVALEEAHMIDKKNQQTQEWVSKMSPTLKKQLISDKTFWYPSTKLNNSIIMKDMKQIFGVGSSRQLQPGEEASILELMIQILESSKDIVKILNTDSQGIKFHLIDIFKQILTFQQLEYLSSYPQCLKQIQYHWQLFVTRLLCIEVKKENNQITNQQLLQLCRRGHALDLRQDRLNNLSQLLLSYLQN